MYLTIPQFKPIITVKHIFEDNNNWNTFCLNATDSLRTVEIEEVNKMLSCKDESRGYFVYQCECCGEFKTVHFGCNSRICTNCGKNHTDKWAKSLKKAMFNVPHRHAVLTIPKMLRFTVEQNRSLLKVLMDAAIEAINDTISLKYRNGQLRAGAIVVLHPFSKDVGSNPHLHILLTEGGFTKSGKFIHQKFIPFKAMRKTWQYQVLTRFKAELSENKNVSEFVDFIFKKYTDGFYVHLPKESRITSKQKIAKYVARYIRHPAVANTRICGYDGDSVTFWYKDHKYLKHFVTMKVQKFIKALIQHIPDRNFKMIRYYGAYARRIKKRYSGYLQRSIKQTTFSDFLRKAKKWVPKCPFCGAPMKFYSYEKGPPKEIGEVNCKITDWCGVTAQP